VFLQFSKALGGTAYYPSVVLQLAIAVSPFRCMIFARFAHQQQQVTGLLARSLPAFLLFLAGMLLFSLRQYAMLLFPTTAS